MRILVADDDRGIQDLVAEALAGAGFELIEALDGVQALACFQATAPDLVIADESLPGIDGLELSRLIRLSSRRRIVPILMLGAPEGPGRLLSSLQAGVLEFLPLPVAAGELRFRVETVARLTRLQRELLAKQSLDEEEMELVKHVLARLVDAKGNPPPPGFHMETLQTRRVNGDACLHREGLPGVHFGMICDATGHGLMAGVSTIPVVETFLGMVDKDLPLERIYNEIHAKLKNLLPTGHFACLLLLRLDVAQGVLSVLNAGMPDALLLKGNGETLRFPARVLPAGIAGVEAEAVVTEAGTAPGDRLLAYSDGLGDLVAPEDMERRYLRAHAAAPHADHCARVGEQIRRDLGGLEHVDDASWALWEVPEPGSIRQDWDPAGADRPAPEDLELGFEVTFTVNPRHHPVRDLVPQVLMLLQGFRVSHAKAQLFGMLLGEALSNAKEHGLLRLDSRIKRQGFEAYEEHRRQALASLDSGSVRFSLALFHEKGSAPPVIRKLRAEVEDTGPGFDWRAWLRPADELNLRPFGRGLALLSTLGRDLAFNETGNRVSFHLDCP